MLKFVLRPLLPGIQRERLNTSRWRWRQWRLLDGLSKLFPHPVPGRRLWDIGAPQ